MNYPPHISNPSLSFSHEQSAQLCTDERRYQVTIRNRGTAPYPVRLWGQSPDGNLGLQNGTPHPLPLIEVIEDADCPFNAPIAIAQHPTSDLFYVANQLADQVTIIDREGQLQGNVQLGNTRAGTNSPVAIAFDHSSGLTCVAGSVSNTVTLIDQAFIVQSEIGVGMRPVAMVKHPNQPYLLVANYADNTVSVVDLDQQQVVRELSVGRQPIGLTVDGQNGAIWVACQGSGELHVFESDLTSAGVISGLPTTIEAVIAQSETRAIYLADSPGKSLIRIDADNLSIRSTLKLPVSPDFLLIEPSSADLLVGSRTAHSVLVFDQTDQLVAQLSDATLGSPFVIDKSTHRLFALNPSHNTVAIYDGSTLQNPLEIIGDYASTVEDFRYNPAYLLHSKWVQVGNEPIRLVNTSDKSVRGKERTQVWHLSNYVSPRHGVNVAEVTASYGTIIDGHHAWSFNLPAGQSVTILIYYYQLMRPHYLKSKSPP